MYPSMCAAVALLAAAHLITPTAATWNFTVYSEPVRLRYGEVYNKLQAGPFGDGLRLPEEVVARYALSDKTMAISGFDVDVVRRNADGSDTQVLLSDHYLHHYILYFGEAKSMRGMLDFAAGDEHAAHKVSGCHGMTGAGVRAYKEHVEAPVYPNRAPTNDRKWVDFGSAAGAEYRHNPQRFQAPYRIIMQKPEVWVPTIHMINTNLADNKTQAAAPAKVSPLLECPCSPQRKIDPAAGTIDGKKADPPIHCSKEFDATHNPSCHLSTYQGGWRCCEQGMFLIDTAKECQTPDCAEKFVDEVFMKFTFYYEDADESTREIEGAACCDVTSDTEGDENIEHDVVPCAPGTPPEQCVYIAESVQPIGYFYPHNERHPYASDLVDLVFAAPHGHWSVNSIELFDHATNETLCAVHRTSDNSAGLWYGTGDQAGNEAGYLTGIQPCTWPGGKAPRFRRDHKLRLRTVHNATTAHTGVMSLMLMSVSAVPQKSDDVVV